MLRAWARTATGALKSSKKKYCRVNGAVGGQVRGMAGGHGEGVTYAGLTLYKPAPMYTWTAEFMGGLMWFWILFRFYNDYETFVFGHAPHFERELAAEAAAAAATANGGEEAKDE